jgi:hypothetical protein
LGERFKMMELYFKLYACCAFIHPGLDGLLDIQQTGGVKAGDIDRISLRFPKSGYKIIDNNPLRSHCAPLILEATDATAPRGLPAGMALYAERRNPSSAVSVSISPMVLLPSLSICADRPPTPNSPKLDARAGFVKAGGGVQRLTPECVPAGLTG